MTSKPTEAYIAEVWQTDWQKAEAEHGSFAAIPADVRAVIEARHRALCTVRTHDGGSLLRHLLAHMVPDGIAAEMVAAYGDAEQARPVDAGDSPTVRGKRGRKAKTGDVVSWCEQHRGELVTIASLCAAVGVAHNTVRKVIRENAALFINTDKRGAWMIATADGGK